MTEIIIAVKKFAILKQLLFTIIATLLIFNSYSQTDKDELARVDKINGNEAYFFSEHLGDHEVVIDVDVGGVGFVKSTIDTDINQLVVKKVNKRRRKGKHARRLRKQTRRIRKDAGKIGKQIRRIKRRGQAKR